MSGAWLVDPLTGQPAHSTSGLETPSQLVEMARMQGLLHEKRSMPSPSSDLHSAGSPPWNEQAVFQPSPLDRQVGEDKYSSPYRDFAIQPAEFCHRNRLGWCEANIVKYTCRYRNKNGLEDLRKAQHYLEMLIEFEYPDTNEDYKKYG